MWGRAAGALRASLLGAAATAAALPVAPVAFGPGWEGPLISAVLGAAFVSLVVRIAVDRGAGVALAAAHLLAAPLWAAVTVRPATDGATALGGLGDATARLLSSLPPVDPRGPEMALAVVAVWGACAVATALAARPRAGAAVLAPALVLFAAGLALGDPRRSRPSWVPALLAVVGGAVLLVAARRAGGAAAAGPAEEPDRRGRVVPAVGRAVVGSVVIAASVAAAVVVAPRIPGLEDRDRVDLRRGRDVPVDVRLGESPLDVLPVRRRADPAPTRFTARVVLPEGHDSRLAWRLAVLDRLGPDGWSASPTTYVPAGEVLGAPPADEAGRRAAARVDLELGPAASGSGALPTLDRPTSVIPSGLAVDRRTGLLAVPAGADRPDRLRLDVALPTLAPADLLGATAPRSDPGDEVPPEVRLRSQQITGGVRQPLEVLRLISDALAGDESLTLDPTRAGLTRTALVVESLGVGATGEGAVVNDAQLAAAFALLARADGLQVRLVVGHLTPVTGRRAEIEVTDASLTVWPEVRFDDLGWVPFPLRAPAGGAATESDPLTTGSGGVVEGAFDQQASAEQARDSQAGEDAAGSPPPAPEADADGGGTPTAAVLGAVAVLALALAAVLVGPLVRVARRRRRRSGGPGARVVGAWDEVVDALATARLVVSSDRTRPEVAGLAGPALGAGGPSVDGVRWLATQADQAAFGAEPVTDDDAARAWTVAADVRRDSRRTLPPVARATTLVRPPRRRRPASRGLPTHRAGDPPDRSG